MSQPLRKLNPIMPPRPKLYMVLLLPIPQPPTTWALLHHWMKNGLNKVYQTLLKKNTNKTSESLTRNPVNNMVMNLWTIKIKLQSFSIETNLSNKICYPKFSHPLRRRMFENIESFAALSHTYPLPHPTPSHASSFGNVGSIHASSWLNILW